ncbi:glycerophosphodiester phosphodiesterase [Lacihabitans soyangensis]|uniref:Glycerophosphodiester phosphodiesterase n=2 Tax=Lacihabitans soyangensis TaxID=869394 RepID=A0AAE3KTN2_9BACT|nr:glycerophosphodiester phosphodiesterase [Lacihabitans soyangensis]
MEAQFENFEIHGHRGCRGLMPENTIPAFKKALELRVDYLELDVVISKDNKVVVSHEPFFNSTFSTKPNGEPIVSDNETNLYAMNYGEIRSYDVGLRGNPSFPEQFNVAAYKPLLSEVIDLVSDFQTAFFSNSVGLNIELKSLPVEYHITQPEPSEFVFLVLNDLNLVDSQVNIVLQSFDVTVLQILKAQRQSSRYFEISFLVEPEDNNEIDFNLEKLGFKPDIWSPNFSVLSKTKVDYLHQKGIKVIPWTVNEVADMNKMRDLGCDGLITDYPNRAIEYIKK